jgi:DNA-binding transcriptional ArsR family regulator
MVVDTADEQIADRLFHALADATRRDIIRRSLRGEHSISDLARTYPMSFAAVQKHVAVLEEAGLVSKDPQGREKLIRSNIDTIRTANRLLKEMEALWRDRIDRFETILEEPEGDI